jgi:hypothetical protein
MSSIDAAVALFEKAALPGVAIESYQGLIMVRIPNSHRVNLPSGHVASEYVLFDCSTLRSGVVICKYSSCDTTDVRSARHYEHLILVEDLFADPLIRSFCIFTSNFTPNPRDLLGLNQSI